MTAELCAGRVVAITGAGRGIGREHALAFAAAGARVVVNDLGVVGQSQMFDAPAALNEPGTPEEVVERIRQAGGEAVAHTGDVATWSGAASLVRTALDAFGGLDVLVNNAGILRDRMLVSMTEAEWDAVVRVHLKGHFAPLRHAAAYWRQQAKSGRPVAARVVNTTSGAGLLGSVGQGNYAVAKAGVAALTLVAAAELGRYGVTVNAIAPAARTRMTEQAMPELVARPERGFDTYHPGNVSPLVVWLGSTESAGVTGRIFEVEGGRVSLADGWRHGPAVDVGRRWRPSELGPVIGALLGKAAPPEPVYGQ
ncbi:SDR family oxidoreductase [Streptantibioticus rubrisoli]|uniref:SDR family oxidoreductase n=1 Tax=Streptantibioticus rubrisoli TaxID=1387313 RepID=A0ABT1PAI9_9ACTN|nr:SDR family oxidoreductase [Streptantibioticus rubrisoli]MCQ4042366.1 SDR family oxidoreductase [Streptantibioticus rubrisoli]